MREKALLQASLTGTLALLCLLSTLLAPSLLQVPNGNGRRVKVNEVDPLYQSWFDFARLQQSQALKFGSDFPVDDRLYGNLRKCGRFEPHGEFFADSLPPSAIEIYAEIGHATTFCRIEDAFLEKANTSFQLDEVLEDFQSLCLESPQTKSRNPTLPKILRVIGASLEIFESNIRHGNLQIWTKHVVRMIQRAQNYDNKWKLFLIAPGLFDLKPGRYTHELTADVMQSVQYIRHKLPQKTMIVVLRNAAHTFVKAAARRFVFCEKMLSQWHLNVEKTEQLWDVLEARIKSNYQTEDFYVHVLNFLEGAQPVLHSKMPDVSVLSSDCVHFSSRGLSLLHTHLWNWLVQPTRQTQWQPLVRPLYCPRPTCPFMVTTKNMWFCPNTKGRDSEAIGESPTGQNVLVLALMCCAMLLYLFIFLYITCFK
ncbi:Protein Y40B10A.9 [Aphelenchoides avenae]|nr:Protein Y40B10A.9 [Aphelenchus avenae]